MSDTGVQTRTIWFTVFVVSALLLLAVVLLVRGMVQNLPPGTTLAGEQVSSPADARRAATQIEVTLASLPIRLSSGPHDILVTGADVGARLDLDTLDAAIADGVGLDDWADRFSGGGPARLPLRIEAAPPSAEQLAQQLSSPPQDAGVTLGLTGVEVTAPVDGVTVGAAAVSEALLPTIAGLSEIELDAWPRPLEVEVAGERVTPYVTRVSVDAILTEIEAVSEAPPIVVAQRVPEDSQTVTGLGPPTREEVELPLDVADVRLLLDVEVVPDMIERERLRLVASTAEPPVALVEFVEAAAVVPDLEITVENRSPTPVRDAEAAAAAAATPGGPADQPRLGDVSGITGELSARVVTPGLEPDVAATVEAIVAAARAGEERVAVQGEPIGEADPALLGITEPVSTWTTFYEPGQARVTNIHRIAEIVDGALIPPGANYEVNHAVGERTSDRGFVPAGAILEGEFVSDVGGGVSQFGTTFFNAMWFAGVDIITHQPHSFWFSRYPAGREATIDFPGVNLELNNNTPHWILVDTAVTDDSVTVTFWSTAYFDVTSSIGPRQQVPGADFRVVIDRRAVSVDGVVDDDDQFTVTYGISP